MHPMMTRLRAALAPPLATLRPASLTLPAAGCVTGIAGWAALHPVLNAFGYGPDAIAAVTLAVAVALAAGLLLTRRLGTVAPYAPLAAAAWLVALPSVMTAAMSGVALVPITVLAGPSGFAVIALAGLLILGLPAFAAGLTAGRWVDRGSAAGFVAATGAGVAATGLVIAPAVGLHAPLLAAAMTMAAAWLVRTLRPTDAPISMITPARMTGIALLPLTAAGAGAAAVAVGGRVVGQLMPAAGFVSAVEVAAVLIGTAVGGSIAARLAQRSGSQAPGRRIGALLLTAGGLFPLAAFAWLIDVQLDANATISSVGRLTLLRAFTAAACMLPTAIGAGLLAGPDWLRCRRGAGVFVFGFVASSCVAWGMLPAVGPATLAAIAAGVALLAALPPLRAGWPRSLPGRIGSVVPVAAVALLAAGIGRHDPAKAARLLFETNVSVARLNGLPANLLPWIDDARLVAAAETPAGHATVWKQRGDLFHLRLDGIPVATASRRPDRCPTPAGDVLRAVLPLLLHPQPNRVLILSDPAGTVTGTAVHFPVRDITCCQTNAAASRLIAPYLTTAGTPFADPRVHRIGLTPRLALVAERRSFDVIVCDPGLPSLPTAAARLTRDYYASAAARLAEGGLFCQRFRTTDLGPAALARAAASMRPVFGEIAAVEVGPGEVLLLGTKPGTVLTDDGFADRLKRPHARAALARLGWDWCVPLNLAVLDATTLRSLSATPTADTDAAGRFAYALPLEVMRWGAKFAELNAAVAGRAGRFFDRGVPERQQVDVLDRLAEVTGQRTLMTAFPDQPWAYRKEVKTQLTERPRSIIQQVSGRVDRVAHPDDRRRLDYFEALGAAIGHPDPASLTRVESFARPYDPLTTYFLHHEVAPLWAGLGPEGAAAALEHRLYAIDHADARDRSVRDVTAAIELVTSSPGLIADPAERFDRLNGLVQTLLARWDTRGHAEPKSPEVVLIDVRKSLAAADAATAAMASLAPAAGLSEQDWAARRAVIDRSLGRPLKSYRSGLIAHLNSKKQVAQAVEQRTAETAAPRLLPGFP